MVKKIETNELPPTVAWFWIRLLDFCDMICNLKFPDLAQLQIAFPYNIQLSTL